MRLAEAWREARARLEAAGIPEASLEAELLLRYGVGKGRSQFYTDLATPLSRSQQAALDYLVERRLRGEPSAYIVGSREFYGLEFYVDRRVLIPRPETEILVEAALDLARHHFTKRELLLTDIGTGCGAIAIALAMNLPQAHIMATDISLHALEVARINSQHNGVAERIQFLQGDLLVPLPCPVDIVVANLPYVAEGEWVGLAPEIREFEPALALAGGGDGLELLRRFFHQLSGKLAPGGVWLVEVGLGQGDRVLEMSQGLFPQMTVELLYDLGGIPRAVMGYYIV